MKEETIKIVDIPCTVTLGFLCDNIIAANKVMIAISERRYEDAICLASEILNANDAIIESNYDKEAIMALIRKDA